MKLNSILLGIGLSVGLNASATTWTPWAVGTGSTDDTTVPGNVTFTAGTAPGPVWTTTQAGNKAFYSTDDFNGRTLGSLIELSYTLVSPPDPTGLSAPYLNIVVTDGTDFSFLLLDAMPVPDGQQKHVFSTAHYKFNESSGGALLAMQNDAKNGNFPSTTPMWGFDDVKNLTIAGGFLANPAGVTPIGGWTGSGADDGIVLAWGNRGGAANYANPVTISGASVVPDGGATLGLLGLSLACLAGFCARKRS